MLNLANKSVQKVSQHNKILIAAANVLFFIYQWSRPHEFIMHAIISSLANMNRIENCMRCWEILPHLFLNKGE